MDTSQVPGRQEHLIRAHLMCDVYGTDEWENDKLSLVSATSETLVVLTGTVDKGEAGHEPNLRHEVVEMSVIGS